MFESLSLSRINKDKSNQTTRGVGLFRGENGSMINSNRFCMSRVGVVKKKIVRDDLEIGRERKVLGKERGLGIKRRRRRRRRWWLG